MSGIKCIFDWSRFEFRANINNLVFKKTDLINES